MRKILIVDDDEQARLAVELALGTIDGISIATAANGSDALAIALRAPGAIDALVTDLNLPGLDGFHLSRTIRERRQFRELPIIVITADSSCDTLRRLREIGVNAVFYKPFSNAQLRSALERLLL